MFHILALIALLIWHAWIPQLRAEVVAIDIVIRENVLGGKSFGDIGPYEKLAGKIFFEFDPNNPANARVTDLDKAPVNSSGRVEASANFMVLKPKKPCQSGCIGLMDISNRGSKAALAYFNDAQFSLDPRGSQDFGDGLIMRKGITVIWVGWQFDVPPQPGLLRLTVPVAKQEGKPLHGRARSDWTVDHAVNTLYLGHRGHIAYPVANPKHPQNTLTVRKGRLAPRKIVPRTEWKFARENGSEVIPDRTHIYKASGFQAGYIYELAYVTQDPPLVGLGLAAVRDTMAFAKYAKDNPFKINLGLAFGVSQTGRFLRHFIYQGFNTDEKGGKVFDGMLIHAAGGGRGSFNHRFAQPSRDAHRYSAFFYPTDLFPFTGRTQHDPESDHLDGLFARAHTSQHLPKVFYTNTGYEYWGRVSALIHTSLDGCTDVNPLPNERIYHFASAQHFVGQFPPTERLTTTGLPAYRGNPLDFRVNLRALLLRLIDWVSRDYPPPENHFPHLVDGTLISIADIRFPELPGIEFPQLIHQAYRVDYGPRWEQGIIDIQPPKLGKPFLSLVPSVDEFGNEIGGIRNVEVRVPLATYTPWHLRKGDTFANRELTDFLGTFIPLSRSEKERIGMNDPRPSVETLYPSRTQYLRQVRDAAQELVKEGLLLPEDVSRVTHRAIQLYKFLVE
jgi:hypothetical protein